MKNILKFYAMLSSVIVIILLYNFAVCPLLNMSNTVANIFGWLLIPIPIIVLWYVFKKLYPRTAAEIHDVNERMKS